MLELFEDLCLLLDLFLLLLRFLLFSLDLPRRSRDRDLRLLCRSRERFRSRRSFERERDLRFDLSLDRFLSLERDLLADDDLFNESVDMRDFDSWLTDFDLDSVTATDFGSFESDGSSISLPFLLVLVEAVALT